MSKILLIWLSLVLSNLTSAQRISNVDFDSIKVKTLDTNSPFFYPQLQAKFFDPDNFQFITPENALYLYYGFVFQDNYKPYAENEDNQLFFDRFKNKNFKDAIQIGEGLLKQNPVSMEILLGLISAYKQVGDSLHSKLHTVRYYALTNAILSSGDGRTSKTALVVIDTKDEYVILERLKVQNIKQTLLNNTDIITLQVPNSLSSEQLCFDIEKPMTYLRHQYKK